MRKSLNKAQEALLRLIRYQAFSSALNALRKMHPADIASLFNYLTDNEKRWLVENTLKTGKLTEVISQLEDVSIPQVLELISESDLVEAVQEMEPDDAVDLLMLLGEEKRRDVFDKLTGVQKRSIGKLLGYAPDTAGGIMTTEYLALPADSTVEEAIEFLRTQEERPEIFYIYVINEHQQFVGVVSFRELVLSKPDKKLKDVMIKDPVSVQADMSQEEAATVIARYDLLALPVVDENHRLLGQITVDDAIDVLYEEATEDIYRLANLGKEDHVHTSLLRSARLRTPWLLVNLGTTILAALTVSLFQETISKYVVLAVLMPVVAGMGGNAGTQSLTVVVRGLALGEIDWSLGWRVVLKEIGVGLVNGLINGLIMGAIAYAWYGNPWLAIIMFFAMIGNLIIAGLFGALVPLVLKKLDMDPALGSSIFVTTATDVGGFVVFLGLASMLVQYLIA
jgi:magnesium transporter